MSYFTRRKKRGPLSGLGDALEYLGAMFTMPVAVAAQDAASQPLPPPGGGKVVYFDEPSGAVTGGAVTPGMVPATNYMAARSGGVLGKLDTKKLVIGGLAIGAAYMLITRKRS